MERDSQQLTAVNFAADGAHALRADDERHRQINNSDCRTTLQTLELDRELSEHSDGMQKQSHTLCDCASYIADHAQTRIVGV